MKERPILFSTEMVQAILADRKRMTRRILKINGCNLFIPDSRTRSKNDILNWTANGNTCKYGWRGDVLWVRETWEPVPVETASIYENATRPEIRIRYKADTADSFNRWHPSIHMPKDIARIWLQIESIAIERLQDITNAEALAEGIRILEPGQAYYDYSKEPGSFANPRGSFFSLWRKINGDQSFESNPWVWVISFKVLSTTGKPANI
ncbi:hypothetical protein JZU46_01830 [bacterium]|jgi:hypothetical protein|nr:hypothetical protein [bacterium]